MPPLLELDDLHMHFFTRDGVVKAVYGVSFTLEQGRTLGVVGESGSGKSVTALSIMRLVPEPPGKVVSGDIRFKGESILEMSEKEQRKLRGNRIAMIFQAPMTSLNPVYRIGQQIAEPLRLHKGMSKKEAWAAAVELLERVGIPQAADRARNYPHEFSGGMRQRAMIAMALACGPDILIADEPTTALDVQKGRHALGAFGLGVGAAGAKGAARRQVNQAGGLAVDGAQGPFVGDVVAGQALQ